MLTEALKYQAMGWSVIPLRFSGSDEERKKPLVDAWEPFKTQPAGPDVIRAWWKQWPKANIGVLMGAVSGMVAIDLDGPNAVQLLRDQRVPVPKTASVKTGKGFHAYYKHPGFEVSNRARLLSDGHGSAVDVRGDGGYVVAPPSIHGNGHVYQWVIPIEAGVADLPPELAALITHRTQPTKPTQDASWVDQAMAGVPQGARDDTATRLAGYWLHRLEGNVEDTLRILRPWAARCDPPFTEADLTKCVRSVARRDAAERQAEAAKHLPRIEVIEGPAWADELEHATPRLGVPMAVAGFDAIGGIVEGDLLVLAGRPGMGKSTLACQLCCAAMSRKLPTYIVSTEMTRSQWGHWMACQIADQSSLSLPVPLPPTLTAAWRSSPIAISDPGAISIADIRKLAEGRLGLKLLVVDHIGRVSGGRRDNRVLEVGDVARGLKSIAKDLRCTVVALCQLNRQVEERDDRRPTLANLRESGEIEQEADAVLFLYTDKKDITIANLPMTIGIAKHRHGPLGKVAVTFQKAKHVFVRAAEDDTNSVPF